MWGQPLIPPLSGKVCQTSSYFTADAKCSMPSSFGGSSAATVFAAMKHREERGDSPKRHSLGLEHPLPLGHHWRSVGLLGLVTGSKAHYLLLPVSVKGVLPNPRTKFLPSHRMLMAPPSPSLCRICSWSRLTPSRAPLLRDFRVVGGFTERTYFILLNN